MCVMFVFCRKQIMKCHWTCANGHHFCWVYLLWKSQWKIENRMCLTFNGMCPTHFLLEILLKNPFSMRMWNRTQIVCARLQYPMQCLHRKCNYINYNRQGISLCCSKEFHLTSFKRATKKRAKRAEWAERSQRANERHHQFSVRYAHTH